MEAAQPKQPHIAILPSPGMGHLIPLSELAKKLVFRHNFSVTFIIPTDDATSHVQAQKSFLQTLDLPHNINCIFLPPVSLSDLPDDTKIESRISLTVNRSLPDLRRTLSTLHESGVRLSALVVDIFGVFAIDVARELNIPPYIFFFSSAMALSLVLHLPKLDETITCEYRDLLEDVRLPGCIPLKGKDLPDHLQDRTNEAYKFALEKSKKYALADGIIVNSFWDLEQGALKALKDEGWCKVPVYPIGPFIQTGSGSESSSSLHCLKWLDEQPDGSVLYVSFGSGGTLSHEQLIELAVGLLMSEKRFLWVVKSPDEKASNAAFFNVESVTDPFNFLPKGFLERTKNKGLVVLSWAPQTRVLSHRATGGFLTHCGWNSCLDGIVNGVPLIAWPLYAEQRMNATLLTKGLKVSLRVEANDRGIVERNQISKLVQGLIGGEEGKEVENRMRDVKDTAAKAWSEIGSSEKALGELARSVTDPFNFLPKGFLERTKNKGLVVPSWAPQTRVLSHRATGGFLTHCGWNSCLDGIVNGVPLIAWPLYAEHRMNAAFLTKGLKVSLRVESNERGIVERNQIAKLVQGLIGGEEGKELENRMRVVKDAAAKAWSEIGSSEKALGELARRWIQV